MTHDLSSRYFDQESHNAQNGVNQKRKLDGTLDDNEEGEEARKLLKND